MVESKEIKGYPSHLQDKTLSSSFRVNRKDIYFTKDCISKHFKKPIKNYQRRRIIEKMRNQIYNETWYNCNLLKFIFSK